MRAKYVVVAVVVALSVAGTAWAFTVNTHRPNDTQAPVANTEPTTVETDNCCLTGECCCPGRGSCCDPAAKVKAADSGVRYVKKDGAGCCATGKCCCPGQGSCCATSATNSDEKTCCSKSEKKDRCTK